MTTGKRRRYNKATTIAARRAALIDAGYRTFVLHGLDDTTMARIGRAAGMSHGIVNYYFGTREDLLTAVFRRALFMVFAETVAGLKAAKSARERIAVVIRAGLTADGFTQECAAAWMAFYSKLDENVEYARVQTAYDARVMSNLRHDLKHLMPAERANVVAHIIAALMDGMWTRRSTPDGTISAEEAIAVIEAYVDREIALAARQKNLPRI
ncbi:MAG: transcriptional regulator BetI [Hyphomicrobiales bacterium]